MSDVVAGYRAARARAVAIGDRAVVAEIDHNLALLGQPAELPAREVPEGGLPVRERRPRPKE